MSSYQRKRSSRRQWFKQSFYLTAMAALGWQTWMRLFPEGVDLTLSATDNADALVIDAESAAIAPNSKAANVYAQNLQATIAAHKLAEWVEKFKGLLQQTALACVQADGQGIIPSSAYPKYDFPRDSFWILAALQDRRLSQLAVNRYRAAQLNQPDGQIPTALLWQAPPNPNALPEHDDESTLFFVLHNYLLKRLGGEVERRALERAASFILSHVRDGGYVTTGDSRADLMIGGSGNTVGANHYWADTFRPAGKSQTSAEIISYNQGLLCVALRCLELLGIKLPAQTRRAAERVYAMLTNAADGRALPQRAGSTIMDVSALVGEALSLYFFDTPLLSAEKVQATLEHFASVRHSDGRFLGFKIISDFYGGYRPSTEFTYSDLLSKPGHYHNGGSWLLYDALALYAGARHQTPLATELLLQRLQSEVRYSWASHEFISTHPSNMGLSEKGREGYGWNTFVLRLLP